MSKNTVMARTDSPDQRHRTSTLRDVLDPDDHDSNILVVGPALSEKDQVAYELLAGSWTSGRSPFAITATDAEPAFRSRFEQFVPTGGSVDDVYVIDCAESSPTETHEDRSTCGVSTPADLTGIGICLAKGYDQYDTGGGRRVLVDNLSTLLIYSEMDRVYRFLSTINRRVTDVGDGTVQLLDQDALASTDRSKLFTLFSTVIEVRSENGSTLFRVHADTQSEWHEFLPASERDDA